MKRRIKFETVLKAGKIVGSIVGLGVLAWVDYQVQKFNETMAEGYSRMEEDVYVPAGVIIPGEVLS
jgi:hypothetical protein